MVIVTLRRRHHARFHSINRHLLTDIGQLPCHLGDHRVFAHEDTSLWLSKVMPPLGARQSNIREAGSSELGDLAPSAHFQTLRPVGTRIDDRLAAGNDVGNHVSRARANPEAMTAKSGREISLNPSTSPIAGTPSGVLSI